MIPRRLGGFCLIRFVNNTWIGRAMTEMMASNGYFVYAGARKHKDMQELNASQKYSYDREALIEMLDKAMSEQ